jgi:hypothetical protein
VEISFTPGGSSDCTLVRSNAEPALNLAGGYREGDTSGCVFDIPGAAGSIVTASASATESGTLVAVPLRVDDFYGDGTTWYVGLPNDVGVSSAVIDVVISSPQSGS